MNTDEVWKAVMADVEMSVSQAFFESYIKRLRLVEIIKKNGSGVEVKVSCPSIFVQREVDRRFSQLIKKSFDRVVGGDVQIEFESGSVASKEAGNVGPLFEYDHKTESGGLVSVLKGLGLNVDLSLTTFAVSSSNEMAYAAAKAVSRSPGTAYNPLFLYGGVGVGKTHLMQGVGQEILRSKLETKTIYCTGEEFTNEIIGAIRKKSTASFKNKYRSVSLLLIDDIQFIAGKNTVQEEFFHTFNAVLKEGGQIIMTSDKPPKDIGALEERLRSRFEGGLIIDIGQPNFELRSAILMIKAKQLGIKLPLATAQVVAEKIEDTRALIGSLMRLSAASEARGEKITPDLARAVLELDSQKNNNSVSQIRVKPLDLINQVADHFGVESVEVRGSRRVKNLVLPRHVAMYLLNKDCKMSLMDVGSWFGGRDHTTVMHAVEKVSNLVKNDEEMRVELESVRKQIYS